LSLRCCTSGVTPALACCWLVLFDEAPSRRKSSADAAARPCCARTWDAAKVPSERITGVGCASVRFGSAAAPLGSILGRFVSTGGAVAFSTAGFPGEEFNANSGGFGAAIRGGGGSRSADCFTPIARNPPSAPRAPTAITSNQVHTDVPFDAGSVCSERNNSAGHPCCYRDELPLPAASPLAAEPLERSNRSRSTTV